jgi:hypothetical protein
VDLNAVGVKLCIFPAATTTSRKHAWTGSAARNCACATLVAESEQCVHSTQVIRSLVRSCSDRSRARFSQPPKQRNNARSWSSGVWSVGNGVKDVVLTSFGILGWNFWAGKKFWVFGCVYLLHACEAAMWEPNNLALKTKGIFTRFRLQQRNCRFGVTVESDPRPFLTALRSMLCRKFHEKESFSAHAVYQFSCGLPKRPDDREPAPIKTWIYMNH